MNLVARGNAYYAQARKVMHKFVHIYTAENVFVFDRVHYHPWLGLIGRGKTVFHFINTANLLVYFKRNIFTFFSAPALNDFRDVFRRGKKVSGRVGERIGKHGIAVPAYVLREGLDKFIGSLF